LDNVVPAQTSTFFSCRRSIRKGNEFRLGMQEHLRDTMPKRDIIVIGASAGGREALGELCRGLPPNLPASIFVVWHMPSIGTGTLPQMLRRDCIIPAQNAPDGATIENGKIYVAPVDHHLLLEAGQVRITKGPKENRFRPAIDPLFRSAAYTYGPRVIGIVLSGALNDGTSGLWTIKDRHGLAIVQDPADALVSSMPLSALENVDVDYTLPAQKIGALLAELVTQDVPKVSKPVSELTETEIKYAHTAIPDEAEVLKMGELSEFTCPECHGTLWQLAEGKRLRFRCRTGHAYTPEALLEDMAESVEAMEWAALRGIEETSVLMDHMAKHLVQSGATRDAQEFAIKAAHARSRAELVRQAILRDDTPQGDNGSGTAPI
jgi:two-component system, chemotaxis family, protein-glutamate methylesterase/glutaminase